MPGLEEVGFLLGAPEDPFIPEDPLWWEEDPFGCEPPFDVIVLIVLEFDMGNSMVLFRPFRGALGLVDQT